MKKTLEKIFAAALSCMLAAAALTSCGDGSDVVDPFTAGTNPNSGSGSGTGNDAEFENLITAANLDWETKISVPTEKLTNATDSQKFAIVYQSNDDKDYVSFKMMAGDGNENELFAGTAEHITIDLTSTKADDLHGCKFDPVPSETAATAYYKPTSDEWTKIKTNGFGLIGYGARITKVGLVTSETNNPTTPENKPSDEPKDNSVTYSTARKAYTVTLPKAVAPESIGYVLQIDNDGEKSAEGLKIDVTGLKLSVTIGDGDAATYTLGDVNLKPSPDDSPAYGKTKYRGKIGLTGEELAQGTKITVQILAGVTVSDKSKAGSIIFALQEEGGSYAMLGGDGEMYKPAFAEAENAEEEEDGSLEIITIEPNVYGTPATNHGLQYLVKATDENAFFIGEDNSLPKSGEKYKLTMVGTADAEFEADMQFVNGWTGITGNSVKKTFTTREFTVEVEFTFTADLAATGNDDNVGKFQFFNNDTSAETRKLTLTTFNFAKVAE